MYCVYFLSNGVNVKVGYSGDVEQRRKSLQGINKCELRLIHLCDGMSKKQAISLEAECHKVLNEHALGGEWFTGEIDPETTVIKAKEELGFSDSIIQDVQERIKESNGTLDSRIILS